MALLSYVMYRYIAGYLDQGGSYKATYLFKSLSVYW